MPAHHLSHVDKHLEAMRVTAGPLQGRRLPSPRGPQDDAAPSPPSHQVPRASSSASNPPNLQVMGCWVGTGGTWPSPLALWSGQGRVAPKARSLLTSRYSRSVSFSSWEVLRIWNKKKKRKRLWEDLGEEGAHSLAVGLGTLESPAQRLHSL